MSMMMYPGAAPPGPGFDPGGGATPAPPPDAAMLQALLAGAGPGAPPGPDLGPDMGGPPGLGPGIGPDEGTSPDSGGSAPMSAVEHIQMAMKHLMMAMTQHEDDQVGHGITRGMATLQGILAGDAKQKLAARGG